VAHFAELDPHNNRVRNIIVVSNDDCGGGDFPASEPIGQAFIASLGLAGEWKQTSYSASFRSKYACIGDIYDSVNDVFVAPEPSE
jgi:hypothetical protein